MRAGGELAATGRIGGEIVAKLLGSLEDYAKTSGQAVPDASQELAKAFADPAKGADLLNERLGFLDDRTLQSVRNLQAQGDGSVRSVSCLTPMPEASPRRQT